ncbi:MAG: ligase-associated DNA damage response DEXH box helicase [Pseudomonadota bacterium]|nr:ligase-associated DNA damage response DEXH box helicase [Pseudomonadota bacterium]
MGADPRAGAGIVSLPTIFERWFASRGWRPRAHQLDCLETGRAGRSFLLIAPTGGGKTLAGFLPSLVDLHENGAGKGLHTLYISPLKALAVDIARNLKTPVEEMGLGVSLETRTGDTPPARRQRQRFNPPDILLTTPEQLALLLSHKDSARLFAGLQCVIVDELHAMAGGKRGHLLALGLARLRALAPGLRATGLSATVPDPQPLLDFLGGKGKLSEEPALIRAAGGARADVGVLDSEERIPWSGHSARHAWSEIYDAIRRARMTLVFVNTRSQAEMTFQALWRMNDDNLAIALHHGSLDVERRRKVEAAMAKGSLRAVVCTSTLDLGIDWGDVDLVIQIGAPKGASRITQRIGRANHRMDEPSRALLIPGNRFEVLECLAAQAAISEGALDGEPPRVGALDVLAQHILGMACAAPFDPEKLYTEIVSAAPYAGLERETFERVLDFVATGGYALKSYDRYRRIVKTPEGLYRIRNADAAQQYRMNVGTIVESPALNIRLMTSRGPKRPGRKLGTLEEWFIEGLTVGDTFLFAGEILRFEGVEGQDALVTRAPGQDPKTPSWAGGKFPLSTYLADRVRRMIAAPEQWKAFPAPVRDWLEMQREHSAIPEPDELLVETFPYVNRHFLVCYPFDGRLAHQTLGMLLTRRLERAGLQPLGFVATEYAVSIWGRKDMSEVDMDALFAEDMLGDDLENWLAESVLMKRTFRNCAVIAGLIERRYPGQEKTGRQVMFSADLIFDVLKEHEPDHILLRAAWEDAAGGYLDLKRLSDLLARVRGRIRHSAPGRVSPLAVPVMLEIGKEPVAGEANEAMLEEASDQLIAEAMRRA